MVDGRRAEDSRYASAPRPSRWVRWRSKLEDYAVVGVVLLVIACAVPHPQGIWYFGGRPHWLIAIDHAGLTVGRSSDPVLLGWIPLMALKLVVVGVPVWLVGRL